MPRSTKRVLNDVIGSTDDLERVLFEKMRAAEEFLRTARALLKQIHGSDGAAYQARASGFSQRFVGVDPYNATVVLLREKNRSLSQEEIVAELLAGNVMTASTKQTSKVKAENVKRSLKANVNNGKLKFLNDRFGFPDWPDEKFTA